MVVITVNFSYHCLAQKLPAFKGSIPMMERWDCKGCSPKDKTTGAPRENKAKMKFPLSTAGFHGMYF